MWDPILKSRKNTNSCVIFEYWYLLYIVLPISLKGKNFPLIEVLWGSNNPVIVLSYLTQHLDYRTLLRKVSLVGALKVGGIMSPTSLCF